MLTKPDLSTPSQRDFWIFIGMMVTLLIPAALTLNTVHHPVQLVPTHANPTPLGYTWSLLIFLVPVAVLAAWFIRHPEYHLEKKAFWRTVIQFSIAGIILDVFFGHTFFTFENPSATLGIHIPGYHPGEGFKMDVPIEELAFYAFGTLFMLLFYIWGDLFWIGNHNPESYRTEAQALPRVVKVNWRAVGWGVILSIAAIAYKNWGPHDYHEGFPGYMILLIFGFVVVIGLFFDAVKALINWRALSMSVAVMWTISIIWEGTLGVPYQWWGYHTEQMVGVFIGAWSNLPIEEILLWTVSSICTITLYEVFRVHYNKDTTYRTTFFGPRDETA